MLCRLALAITLLWYAGIARADDPPAAPAAAPAVPAADATAPPPPATDATQQAAPVDATHVETVVPTARTESLTLDVAAGSYRGTAEEFFVLPSGMDVGARLRTVMADGGLGPGKLKLTDVALFDLAAQWAIAKHYELDGSLTVLPKQPSSTSEPIFQGGSLALRRDVATRTAVALAGSGAPLLGVNGIALGGSLSVEHKHRLNEIVTFALAGGATSTYLRPTGMTDHPLIVEAAGHASVLARVPNGVWGGWFGVGYAVPAYHRGLDPVSGMALDPQPRLDLNLGNAVQLADRWDLSVDLSIIDRGDLANPATRLPILDGGFDQIQLMVGVSRRLDLSSHSDRRRGITDPLILL
ncbi:MAG TPA: hypothetical protein VIV40_24870 [Kofleriaceae bacterium]